MGGVSTFRDCDKHVLYNKIDTKSPKIRETKKTFKHFIIHVFFSSNTDTGKDRLTILYAYHPIFEKELSVDEETLDLHFNFSDWDKLQFIVDNPSMPNASPGAFECRITIKEIRE
jgi:hypothetical protein